MTVLVLSGEDVRAVLSPEGCATAMAEVLAARAREEAYNPLRAIVRPPAAPGFMGLMPAYATAPEPTGTYALKALCIIPDNPARGLDSHQGTVTLFDGETGRPTAILDASAVTEVRTAAVTAVATDTLARPDARILAILGAGVQGRSHLRALRDTRGWEEIRMFAPSRAHTAAAAAGDERVRATDSAREAVQGADVVVCATASSTPVLERAWLADGAHVAAVGASVPHAMEIDVATFASAAVFCDSRESVAAEAGEFHTAVQTGAIAGLAHIRAELGEVLAGLAPGRTDAAQLTLFRSLGIGVEDLAAAQTAVAAARAQGCGTEVDL